MAKGRTVFRDVIMLVLRFTVINLPQIPRPAPGIGTSDVMPYPNQEQPDRQQSSAVQPVQRDFMPSGLLSRLGRYLHKVKEGLTRAKSGISGDQGRDVPSKTVARRESASARTPKRPSDKSQHDRFDPRACPGAWPPDWLTALAILRRYQIERPDGAKLVPPEVRRGPLWAAFLVLGSAAFAHQLGIGKLVVAMVEWARRLVWLLGG